MIVRREKPPALGADHLREVRPAEYNHGMIIIRFPDPASERRALGWLVGRFSFKTWSNGETLVPNAALPALALEGVRFIVEGPATYERLIPTALRDAPASPVQ